MIQKKQIEMRIGRILSVTEAPVRVLLQYEKKPSEIFIEKMSPEKWWCLLIQKDIGENCIFESYKVGRKLKVVPSLECEDTIIPEEALELLEIIATNQKRRHEVHELLCGLTPKFNKIRREIINLIELGEKRTARQKAALTQKRKTRNKLESKINKCHQIIADYETVISDLTIRLRRL